jgi:hypothetical protein
MTNQNGREKWLMEMETIWEGGEAARQLWREMLLAQAENPNDPHDLEYYEDLAEVMTVAYRMENGVDFVPIEIGDDEFSVRTPEESVFVAWIRHLMSKGLGFEQAFDKAREITMEEDPNLDHIVYELCDGDKFVVDMWRAQLEDQGMDPLKAQEKAEDIVKILIQQHFAKDADWFDEFDKELCDQIHQKLASARASVASA